MPPRRIVCPDCGESVPGGRLSCPSCGALLASVAGVPARAGATANDASSGGAGSRAARGVAPAAMSPARIQTQALPEAPTPGAEAPTPSVNLGPAIPLNPTSIRQTEVDGPSPVAAVAVEAAPMEAAPMEAAPIPAPVVEVSMLADDDETVDRGYDRGYGPDGGYVPPAYATLPDPVPATAVAAMPTPAAPVATANASNGTAAGSDDAKMDQALGYATAAGAGLVAFGMLMPWARVVIGSSGATGIFDTWGLAGPGHILLLAWAVVVLVVSVIPNRHPRLDPLRAGRACARDLQPRPRLAVPRLRAARRRYRRVGRGHRRARPDRDRHRLGVARPSRDQRRVRLSHPGGSTTRF